MVMEDIAWLDLDRIRDAGATEQTEDPFMKVAGLGRKQEDLQRTHSSGADL
jgi:hypothetical protein